MVRSSLDRPCTASISSGARRAHFGAILPNGAVTAEGVDQHGPSTHQQFVGPVQHQHAMALGALDRHETRARPGDRIADRLGVSRTSCPGAEIFRAR